MKKTTRFFRFLKTIEYLGYLCVFFLYLNACNGNKTPSQKSTVSALPPSNEDFYQDITANSGIDFVHTIGDDHLDNIVESVGGGAAFLDFDQDGFLDLYVCNGTYIEGFSHGEKPSYVPENHLYRNLQNGTFEDVTKKAGVGDKGYGMGVTIGDYNNDGFPDIFVSNYGPNALYRNNGNGTFTDVTKKAGVSGGKFCSIGAVWLDYDNDGFLDLYVGNYLYFDPDYKYYYAPDGFPGPLAYDAEPDILYHNNGDGTFEEVTEKMGISDTDGRAMGVGAADYDKDGFADIYVANDHTVNYLFNNQGGKKFTDKGIMSGTAFSQSGEATISMAVDFADYNDDGLLDMFVSDDTYCSLYENKGNGVFADNSYISGIAMAAGQFVGWTSSFIDYDNDGDEDIFKVNGEFKHLYGQEDQLYENMGDGKFKDVSVEKGSYFKKELVGRGACFGDYDNDGDIDAFIMNLNSHGVLLRNNKGNQNNWLLLNLVSTSLNKDALGTNVALTSGGKTQFIQKICANGYLSQNDPRLHFGLGTDSIVDKIEIRWPSGTVQTLENIKANQILIVKESSHE